MISPGDLKSKMLRQYKAILKEELKGESRFPYGPKVDLSLNLEDFQSAVRETRALRENSIEGSGAGFNIEDKRVNSRRFGPQTLPSKIIFNTAGDYFTYLGKEEEARAILDYSAALSAEFPELTTWAAENLPLMLRNLYQWQEVMAALRGLMDLDGEIDLEDIHPRDIPLPSIDTKFVEKNKTVLSSLLNQVQKIRSASPSAAGTISLDSTIKAEGFLAWARFPETRPQERSACFPSPFAPPPSFFGAPLGIFPVDEFAKMNPPVNKVIIIENKLPFLNLNPSGVPMLVIWGGGNGCRALEAADWLNRKQLIYWGDLDLHGFAILGRLRQIFPHLQSVGMDKETLLAYPEHIVPGKPLGKGTWYKFLTPGEKEAVEYLEQDPQRSRLEQERIDLKKINILVGEL